MLACLCACGNDSAPPSDGGMPDAGGVLALSPSTFDYGDVDLAIPQPLQAGFTLTNTGDADVTLELPLFAITGADADDFAISNQPCPGALAPGEACGVVVTFQPRARATRVATLVATGGATAALSGSGVSDRNVLVIPAARNFGDITAGTAGTPFTFTVINELADAPVVMSPLPEGFTVVGTTCTGTVAVHSTCTLDIALAPAHGGSFSGNLDITIGAETATSGLSGASTTPLALAPFTQLFGQVLIGNTGGTATLTVKNTSTVATGTLGTAVLGGDFTIQSTTCTTLAPDETCDITVQLTPATRGAKLSQLEVTDLPSGLATRAGLRGDAYTLLIVGNATFPDTQTGQTSARQAYTVINASSSQTGAITTLLTGSADFVVASNTCAAGLAGNSSCTIELTLAPSSTGARSATLSVSASPGSTDDQVVSGNGI
jgi:hypothetical protein